MKISYLMGEGGGGGGGEEMFLCVKYTCMYSTYSVSVSGDKIS